MKLHCDSFDLLPESPSTSITDFASSGVWTGQATTIYGASWYASSTYSRFGVGKGAKITYGSMNSLYLPAASGRSTYFIACSTRSDEAFNGTTSVWAFFSFQNGTNPQVTVTFCRDGVVRVYRGGTGGTLIATFTSATASQTWEHWQMKVVIASGTGGSIRLRKDGSSTDTFFATGLNTLASGSATCDSYAIGSAYNTSAIFDDVIFWDDNPAETPNDWIGDIRSYPLYARAAGSQTDMTPYAAPVLVNSSSNTSNYATGTTRMFQFTSSFSGSVNSIALTLGAALTGKLNIAIYSDSGANLPVTKLGTATELTNPAIGLNQLTFGTPVSVVAGTKYWVAVASDATVSLYNNTGSSAGVSLSAAYASAFPTTASSLTTGVTSMMSARIYYTPLNYSAVNQSSYDGDSSYVYSQVIGATDLYRFDALPYTPNYVLMVNVKSIARKSDTNSRSLRNKLLSGTVTTNGTTVLLSSTYRTIEQYLLTDPNTGAAWTKAGIDAIEAGPNVVA